MCTKQKNWQRQYEAWKDTQRQDVIYDVVNTKTTHIKGRMNNNHEDGLLEELKGSPKAPQEYAVEFIVRHNGKGSNFKYVVPW